jgi:hypothetical protein
MSMSSIQRSGEILDDDDLDEEKTTIDPPRFAEGSGARRRSGSHAAATMLGMGVLGGGAPANSLRIARPSTPAPVPPPPAPAPPTPTPTPPEPTVIVAPEPPSPYADLEAIGLGAKPATSSKAAKLVVSTYRMVGFGILSLIVFVLIGYIATTTFYFFNHTWVAPVTVSPTDEKVVALRTQLAEAQNQRDKIVADIDDTDRGIAAEEQFEAGFVRAIKSDLDSRRAALGRVRDLASAAAAARSEIHRANDQYADQQRQQMAQEYDAKLIDRTAMLAGKYQLAQISGTNLSLAQRQAELETQAHELATEASSLDALLENKDGSSALSYDVLKIKRDYDTSKRELARALENRRMLTASLARQDAIIAGLGQSSYLRALDDKATVALVPYENLDGVAKGTPLYACRLAMVGCRQVGTVLEVLPGEVTFKHPHRDTEVRGQMVELRMTDVDAAQSDVLFLERAPLWL